MNAITFIDTEVIPDTGKTRGMFMEIKRKGKYIWFCIFVIACLIYFVGYYFKLSIINPQIHFYFKMGLFIIFVIALNKTVGSNLKFIKYILIIMAIIFVTLSSLYHLFFEQFMYVTVIDLNGQDIAVQEHSMYDEYCVSFYKVKYRFLKQFLISYFCLDYPAFHNGDYRVIYSNDQEVLIEYRNPNYDFPQRVTVKY